MLFEVDEESLGIYKSPLFPQADSIDEILIKKRNTTIAVNSQFTQQIFLNMMLAQTKNQSIPSKIVIASYSYSVTSLYSSLTPFDTKILLPVGRLEAYL